MNLAAIPSPTVAAWQVGPLTIRAYALCIVLGIVVACWVTERRMRQRGAPPYFVLDVAIWAVPFGIIGARVYHVITSYQLYFSAGGDPWGVFQIWHGGLGIWGGVAGGALGAWFACRQRGVPLTFVADALAPGLPLAQAVGRLGNWFNNELYGRATSLPWGLRVHAMDADGIRAQTMDGKPVVYPDLYQPTFLYELIWDVGVAVLVFLLDRKYRFGKGRAFALYVMAYTVGRAWVEALRIDDANHILGLRLNDWTSIVVFLGALIYFLRARGPAVDLVVNEDGSIETVPAGEAASGDATAGEAATDEAEAGEAVAEAGEEGSGAETAGDAEGEADAGDGDAPEPAGGGAPAESPDTSADGEVSAASGADAPAAGAPASKDSAEDGAASARAEAASPGAADQPPVEVGADAGGSDGDAAPRGTK